MRIAILGATSQIAKDLILSFHVKNIHDLVLYARRPEVVSQWLIKMGLSKRYIAADFSNFSTNEYFDTIFNFVGVGDPAQAIAIGYSIFDVTFKYDQMALDYVHKNPQCRYFFLSSGAAYGSNFDAPANKNTKSVIAINDLNYQDWYGIAKLHAECRHRALAHLSIIDLRIFNYFSHTQDMSARFLIMDIIRAIRKKIVLKTLPNYIVRDFLHPSDFYKLVEVLLSSPRTNLAVDCYSQAPIDKPRLLLAMQEEFGLQYEITREVTSTNATGSKSHYYSQNMCASDFGYRPALTSLQGVLQESTKLFMLNSNE